MASAIASASAVTCAENISLLHLLHSNPNPPTRNPIHNNAIRLEGYTLSFERERSLTGVLAFLSSTSDDPNYIPAVAIQERAESKNLDVILAVNETEPGSGSQLLNELRLGFDKIFAILNQVTYDGIPGLQSDVLAAIIAMCSARILCRLRLKANSRLKPKRPVKDLLQDAIIALQADVAKKKIPTNIFKIFEKGARSVSRLIDNWSRYQVSETLGEVIEGMYQLSKIENLSGLLDNIPNTSMDPSSRKNLLNIIRKVARYWQAARFLYRSARKFPLVRHMAVVLATLPDRAFSRHEHQQIRPPLSGVLSRLKMQQKSHLDANTIAQYLKLHQNDLNSRFATQTRTTLEEAKIHAEIQIIYHCELDRSERPPRVICSSKDACYLCNSFIKIYGKIHTPRSHGRLYPGWRLPFLAEHDGLQQRLNIALQKVLHESLTNIAKRKKRILHPDPNESTLLTLISSASTLPGPVNGESVNGDEEPNIPMLSGSAVDAIAPTVEIAHEVPNISRREGPEMPTQEDMAPNVSNAREVCIGGGSSSTLSSSLDSLRSSLGQYPSDSCLQDWRLSPGKLDTGSVGINELSTFYTTSELEVQIEYSGKLTTERKDLNYIVQWLTPGELYEVQEHRAVTIIDAEALYQESVQQIDGNGCIYLSGRGHVLKLIFRPDTGSG